MGQPGMRHHRDGFTFDVRTAGPDDGEPVILLHGFPEDAESWDAVAAALASEGYRCLAPDQRGYSPGARPRWRWQYTLGELVADVLALADAAGAARVHLVGHDWGAAVAWEVARRRPDRVATLTALSVPHPAALAWALRHADQARRSWYVAAFQLPGIEVVLARRLGDTLAADGLSPDHAHRYGERFRDPAALRTALHWYRALPFAGVGEAGRRAGEPVRVPTTYVWGDDDPYIGRAAAERCGAHVDADFRFVTLDAHHWLPENWPGEVASHVLERVRSAPLGGRDRR